MEESQIPYCTFKLHVPTDAYRPTLEEIRFLKNHHQFITKIQKSVRFDIKEIQSLLLIYRRLLNQCEVKRDIMTGAQFIIILYNTFNMTDHLMNERIVQSFKTTGQTISMVLWLKALSLFFKGNLEEKIEFCYGIYDIRNIGFIGKETMMRFLKGSILTPQGHEDDDAVIDLIDIVSKKMDIDRDGKVSFDDYKQTVRRQPCLLEFLGQCLPDHQTCRKLLSTLATNVIVDIPINSESFDR